MVAVQQTPHGSEFDAVFPAPSPPPTVLSPSRYPGVSPEAVAALRYVLTDNHTKYHMFYKGYLRHTAHHALALYALGASGSLIEQSYERGRVILLPAVEPPEAITEENFMEHLGDDKFYVAYVTFFIEAIEEKGVSTTLDEYIFSEKYNFIEGRDASTQPVMLNRFLSGVIHALIHVGHATEFGIPGMVAQGLAMASVHWPNGHMFFPPSLFKHGGTPPVEEATTRLASLCLNTKISIAPSQLKQPHRNHAFSILAKIMQDPELAMKKQFYDFPELTLEHGANIWRYAEQWTIDLSQPGEIERKMEECIWTNTVLYAICGWRKDRGFTADFIFMHLVTSSLFLPSVLSYLPKNSQVMLLRTYFASTLAWWIARNSPRLDIRGFIDATSSPVSSEGKVSNPFLNFLGNAITQPEDHVLKIQRAFAHFSSLYGARPKGYFKGTELDGAEALDGSLFLTATRLTDEYTIQGGKTWDREGLTERISRMKRLRLEREKLNLRLKD
ncbi:hypothetical protein DFH29DRAFT_819371 [Suillus ampliporus]|nr:hypothetical protein DFH29DRAFT_819371 [Suillus ampliporus]